ncbi:maleylpyruvate isomerase family mycothiol-dependent enzyme [Streptomyces sp. NPDC049585]|uniref:maleylpyruvate isomerase family mycothiol-dependent enzyme n=1 Tax=Streptomyces sp. NPDC049585 TaxID=3155154 RepID=UPI00342BDE54
MIDHVQDLASLREATERLVSALDGLDDHDGSVVTAPSRLPGWSRGHVLAHLARNADALVNVLEGRPMYPSAQAREADIERGAPRPLAEQLTDLRESAEHFFAAAAAPADWTRTVELRGGVTDVAARVPFRRLVEVELHHVDLGIGYELEDLPAGFTANEIGFLAERFTGNPDVPALRLEATGGGRWSSGRAEGDPLTVTGSAADLLGWLAGRRDGAGLEAGGVKLPVLPSL